MVGRHIQICLMSLIRTKIYTPKVQAGLGSGSDAGSWGGERGGSYCIQAALILTAWRTEPR